MHPNAGRLANRANATTPRPATCIGLHHSLAPSSLRHIHRHLTTRSPPTSASSTSSTGPGPSPFLPSSPLHPPPTKPHTSSHIASSPTALSSIITPPPPPPEADPSRNRPARKLILMRHADSANPPDVRDHDRPISEVGKQQAREVAQMLIERGWVPDIVLASNALRTRQTLEEMAQVMESLRDVDTHLYGSLYTVAALDGQTREHIEECLLEVVDDTRNVCVAVVGHNKGMEEAASSFAATSVKLGTASVALLQASAASWTEVLVAAGAAGSSGAGVKGAAATSSSSAEKAASKAATGARAGKTSRGSTSWQLVDVLMPPTAGP